LWRGVIGENIVFLPFTGSIWNIKFTAQRLLYFIANWKQPVIVSQIASRRYKLLSNCARWSVPSLTTQHYITSLAYSLLQTCKVASCSRDCSAIAV